MTQQQQQQQASGSNTECIQEGDPREHEQREVVRDGNVARFGEIAVTAPTGASASNEPAVEHTNPINIQFPQHNADRTIPQAGTSSSSHNPNPLNLMKPPPPKNTQLPKATQQGKAAYFSMYEPSEHYHLDDNRPKHPPKRYDDNKVRMIVLWGAPQIHHLLPPFAPGASKLA